jgi:hypothetical protein
VSINAQRDREGIISFINAIQKNETLTNIDLRGNKFDNDITHEIKSILKEKINFQIYIHNC